MSLGVNAESKNKRGHTALDVCTDNNCKELLKTYSQSTHDFISNIYFDSSSEK